MAAALTLLEVPQAYRLPELIVARARELAGRTVALYVVDLDGSSLVRLAGEGLGLPERVSAPLAVGPELAVDAVEAVRALVRRSAPEMVVVPMVVRDRAVGVLISASPPVCRLEPLAPEAAVALELVGEYSDVVHAARRHQRVDPAAEIQQNLLPPGIATLSGANVAASVLPGYQIGGDFFDYADNSEGLWLTIGDAVGKGNAAAALSSIALGALRAARRAGATLPEAGQLMHTTIKSCGELQFITAIIALCSADGTLRWLTYGHPPPLIVDADGTVLELTGAHTRPLGIDPFDTGVIVGQARLAHGQRLVLYSDGLAERRLASGGCLSIEGIQRVLGAGRPADAAATVRTLHSAAIEASAEPLHDDVTVLAVTLSDP